uniref:Chromatin assembly factor 1 subunit A n=1 Tax=Podarcis muralis TaxID=64176 RepID=A0A670K8Z7_PODMU
APCRKSLIWLNIRRKLLFVVLNICSRLPFKRLNPIPKEKLDGSPGVKRGRNSQNVFDQNTPCPGLSHPLPDNVENSCHEETETQFVPKLINGKGPLDSFLPFIDLTEDSNHRLSDTDTDHCKSNKVAAPVEKTHEETEAQSGPQKPVCNTPVDVLMATCPVTPDEDELSDMVLTKTETNSTTESKHSNVIFERKMPVIVLEDILTARSPQASPLERSLSSGNETIESCPGESKDYTNSSLSSASLTSSPESLCVQGCKDNISPMAASTPRCLKSSSLWGCLLSFLATQDQERAEKLQKQQAEREEKGRLKEEAKAAKERAREEAKRKKEEEKELKDKERREKREKEEKEKAEKLRAKEEKRKEKQERIKAEKAEITRFFQKPKTQPAPKILAGWCGRFAPFEIKENMVLAPICRVAVDQDLMDQLDWLLQAQSYSASFLEELKSRDPCKTGPTLVSSPNADAFNSDVVIVSSSQAGDVPERKKFGRMKLLQFCENHRPAYWGTWNKKSSAIRPRNPWSKEEDDDDEGGEEEDDDDGFFVPHGYLSEDEGVTEECDPENYKARQKLKAKEWDELITKGKRFRVLQPVKIGCVWEGKENSDADLRPLQQFTVSVLDSTIADEDPLEKSSKKKTKDQQILGQLLPLLHGNVNGSKVIIQEFQECCRLGVLQGNDNNPTFALEGGDASPTSPNASWAQAPAHDGSAIPSKARLKRIISENSVYEKRPDHRMCWYVHPEVLKSYGQENLPVPCQWNYVTQVSSAGKEDASSSLPGGAAIQTTPVSAKRKSTGSMSITKFMKRPFGTGQAETTEMDGFQADTEEEDDDECMIVDVQQSKGEAPGSGTHAQVHPPTSTSCPVSLRVPSARGLSQAGLRSQL